MTPDDFRRIALSFPEASESAHMNHPDFRVRGKVFATLGYPDSSWGVVKLTPEQQSDLLQLSPASFEPVPGGWGRQGSSRVRLETADESLVQEALSAAWHNVAHGPPKKASKKKPKALR